MFTGPENLFWNPFGSLDRSFEKPSDFVLCRGLNRTQQDFLWFNSSIVAQLLIFKEISLESAYLESSTGASIQTSSMRRPHEYKQTGGEMCGENRSQRLSKFCSVTEVEQRLYRPRNAKSSYANGRFEECEDEIWAFKRKFRGLEWNGECNEERQGFGLINCWELGKKSLRVGRKEERRCIWSLDWEDEKRRALHEGNAPSQKLKKKI